MRFLQRFSFVTTILLSFTATAELVANLNEGASHPNSADNKSISNEEISLAKCGDPYYSSKLVMDPFYQMVKKIKGLDELIKEETVESYRLQVKKHLEELKGLPLNAKLTLIAKHKIASSGLAKLSVPTQTLAIKYTGSGSDDGLYDNAQWSDHSKQTQNDFCLLAKADLLKNHALLYELAEKDLEAHIQAVLKKGSEGFSDPFETHESFWLSSSPAYSSSYLDAKFNNPEMPPESPEEAEYWKIMGQNRRQQYGDYYGKDSYKDNRSGLNPAEIEALIQYTGSGYHSMNAALRKGGEELNEPGMQIQIKILNSALGKLPNYIGPVNRGATLPEATREAHAMGKIVSYPAFTSTSMAGGFSGKDRFVIYSKMGKDVSGYSSHESEKEVLFRAGSKFKIIEKIEIENKNFNYIMVEVP